MKKFVRKLETISLVVLMFFIIGASSCAVTKLTPDTAMAAIEAQDPTVIIGSCGNQPIVGYGYCRKVEGSNANEVVTLHVPPATCMTKPCVKYTVFFPDESVSLGGSVPDGQTQVDLKWSDLTKKQTFDRGDVGVWVVLVEVKWIGTDDREHTSFAEGEIKLRVLPRRYAPLHNTPTDTAYVWQWTSNGRVFKYTTAMRAYTGQAK